MSSVISNGGVDYDSVDISITVPDKIALDFIETYEARWHKKLGVLTWERGDGINSHYEVQAPTLREAIFKGMEKMKCGL